MKMQFVEQEIQALEDFSNQMFDAMRVANVDDINPAIVSFALTDILSLYCIHSNIPLLNMVDLLKNLYAANVKIVNEDQSSTLQ